MCLPPKVAPAAFSASVHLQLILQKTSHILKILNTAEQLRLFQLLCFVLERSRASAIAQCSLYCALPHCTEVVKH